MHYVELSRKVAKAPSETLDLDNYNGVGESTPADPAIHGSYCERATNVTVPVRM